MMNRLQEMNLRSMLLFLLITTPVLANLEKAVEFTEQENKVRE